MKRIRLFKSRCGYTLLWVLIVLLVMAVTATIAVTASWTSMRSTQTQHNMQQSYFTARSAAASVAQYIVQNAENTSLIENLMLAPGTGTVSGMGDYTVQVAYADTNKIRVSATATVEGETTTVAVYLIKPPAPSGIIPTDNLIYLNGSGSSGFGQCIINGDMFIDGDFTITNGSDVNGYTVVKGNAILSGGSNSTNGLFCYGNVSMLSGASINGDVLTKGDLYMDGSGKIIGNAYADGSLSMVSGGPSITMDAVIGKNAAFGGGSRINGKLSYGGNVTCTWGTVSSFVMGGTTKLADYTPIDDSQFDSQPLTMISTPTQAQLPSLYNTVVINNNIISSNGTINASVVSLLAQKPWGTTITIDTNTKDISLLLTANLSLNNGLNIVATGPHNVYLYMTGSSSISVNSNEYIGMQTRGTNPKIFIFGDGAQTISLNANSELDAVVYMPEGTLNASGSPLDTYKFIGSCIVKTINVSSNVTFQYSPPNLDGTPLAIYETGQSGSGDSTWTIESWDDN